MYDITTLIIKCHKNILCSFISFLIPKREESGDAWYIACQNVYLLLHDYFLCYQPDILNKIDYVLFSPVDPLHFHAAGHKSLVSVINFKTTVFICLLYFYNQTYKYLYLSISKCKIYPFSVYTFHIIASLKKSLYP